VAPYSLHSALHYQRNRLQFGTNTLSLLTKCVYSVLLPERSPSPERGGQDAVYVPTLQPQAGAAARDHRQSAARSVSVCLSISLSVYTAIYFVCRQG
jgi:hypothetical protein